MENKLTPKQALEELKFQVGNITYFTKDLQATTRKVRDSGLFETIEQALTELEETKQINEIFKNAITIKHRGIHYEEKLDHSIDSFIYAIQPICEVIQNAIEEELKRQLREWVLKNAFPKELQILKVLKTKKVDIWIVDLSNNVKEYNNSAIYEKLTKIEFNLIKEWLK